MCAAPHNQQKCYAVPCQFSGNSATFPPFPKMKYYEGHPLQEGVRPPRNSQRAPREPRISWCSFRLETIPPALMLWGKGEKPSQGGPLGSRRNVYGRIVVSDEPSPSRKSPAKGSKVFKGFTLDSPSLETRANGADPKQPTQQKRGPSAPNVD